MRITLPMILWIAVMINSVRFHSSIYYIDIILIILVQHNSVYCVHLSVQMIIKGSLPRFASRGMTGGGWEWTIVLRSAAPRKRTPPRQL